MSETLLAVFILLIVASCVLIYLQARVSIDLTNLLLEIYRASGGMSHQEIVRLLKVATHKQEGGK